MTEWFYNLVRALVPLVVVLLAVFTADTITGILKAKQTGTFSSTKLRSGFTKLAGYFAVIVGAVAIDFILNWYIQSGGYSLEDKQSMMLYKVFTSYYVTKGITLFTIVIEIISILENAKILGVDIPNWFMNLLKNVKKFLSSEGYIKDSTAELKEAMQEKVLSKEELADLLWNGNEDMYMGDEDSE